MRRRLLLLLAVLLLLSGCKPNARETQGPANTPTPITSQTPEETAFTTEPEPAPAPIPSEEDPIPIDEDLYSPKNGRYTLLETEDVLVEVAFAKGFESGEAMFCCAENRTDGEISVEATDFLINGNIQTDEFFGISMTVPAGAKERKRFSDHTLMECELIGFDNLRELSASVKVEGVKDMDPTPIPCRAEFPDGVRPVIGYDSFMGMRADRQVLRADGDYVIALLGCGDFLIDSAGRELTGVLWIENRGDETVPVKLSSVSVNGYGFPISAQSLYLEPKTGTILTFSVYKDDIDLAGIKAIDSLRLQILTSEEENSGIYGLDGGTWYPAALAQSCTTAEAAKEGVLLYKDGLLSLTLTGIETSDRSERYREITYVVTVENNRQEGVCLRMKEPLIDGDLYRNVSYDGGNFLYIRNDQIGPGSRGVVTVTLSLLPEYEPDRIPELSFLLQVLSQGKDVIFYTTTERIVLSDRIAGAED